MSLDVAKKKNTDQGLITQSINRDSTVIFILMIFCDNIIGIIIR